MQASDAALSAAVARELAKELGPDKVKQVRPSAIQRVKRGHELSTSGGGCLWQALNVSADSFYSSQGRRDELFHDRSEGKDNRRQGGMRHKNRATG